VRGVYEVHQTGRRGAPARDRGIQEGALNDCKYHNTNITDRGRDRTDTRLEAAVIVSWQDTGTAIRVNVESLEVGYDPADRWSRARALRTAHGHVQTLSTWFEIGEQIWHAFAKELFKK